MNRLELYQYLCETTVNGHGGIAGYLKRNFPNIHATITKELTGSFDKVSLYCYLTDIDPPKCGNPSCKRSAKFGHTIKEGFRLFCNGTKCYKPFPTKDTCNQPPYAKELTRKLRELKVATTFGRYGVAGWLFGRVANKIVIDCILHLGYTFGIQELYDFLFPGARKDCCVPECSRQVTFNTGTLHYRNYCSLACAGKDRDPAVYERRAENYLIKTGGKYSNYSQTPEAKQASRELRASEEYKELRRNNELARSGGRYTHHAQRPEQREQNSNLRKDLTYKEYLVEKELARSGGRYKYPVQRPEVREKMSATQSSKKSKRAREKKELERSNGKYRHCGQRPESLNDGSSPRYQVNFCGDSWFVQGYEDVALRFFIKEFGVAPEDIKVPFRTSFKYLRSSGKFHRYYPDFRIHASTRNFFIEVKSTLTSSYDSVNKRVRPVVIEKLRGVVNAGKPALMLIIDEVKGRKGGKPRTGEIIAYVYATAEHPDFTIKKKVSRLPNIVKSLYEKP